jgi:arsenate reductase
LLRTVGGIREKLIHREIVKKKAAVLFVCVHNSARSQMAAALMNKTCGECFEAESAGLEPGQLNPHVVKVLMDVGIDISKNQTQRVFDLWKSGRMFQYVITVCSEAEAEGCPLFPSVTIRLHWPFPDPLKVTGTEAEKLEQTRRVMDQIQERVDSFCEEHCTATAAL